MENMRVKLDWYISPDIRLINAFSVTGFPQFMGGFPDAHNGRSKYIELPVINPNKRLGMCLSSSGKIDLPFQKSSGTMNRDVNWFPSDSPITRPRE